MTLDLLESQPAKCHSHLTFQETLIAIRFCERNHSWGEAKLPGISLYVDWVKVRVEWKPICLSDDVLKLFRLGGVGQIA